MKVLVCGGRRFDDYGAVCTVLDRLLMQFPSLEIVSGGATGADTLSVQWAQNKEVPYHVYPARWTKYKKSAGPIRNSEMLEKNEITLGVAFPGGPGTADMVDKMKFDGIPVFEWKPPQDKTS